MGRYAAVSASPAPLTADDLAALAFVNEAVIAPAGDRVAYAVRRVDLQADRYRAALFVSSVDGSGATRWTDGTAEDATPAATNVLRQSKRMKPFCGMGWVVTEATAHAEATAMPVCAPVMVAAPVSVVVIDCVPTVLSVALNVFDGSRRYSIQDVRGALDLEPGLPIVLCDARHRESAKEILIALVEHVLAQADADEPAFPGG